MIKAIVLIVILSSINAVALVFVFMEIGSPFEARLRAVDTKRIQQLQTIKYQIDNYVYTNNRVPQSLNDVKASIYDKSSLVDTETGAEFEYIPVNASSYQLCGVFSTKSKASSAQKYTDPSDVFKTYDKGRYCFVVDNSSIMRPTVSPPASN